MAQRRIVRLIMVTPFDSSIATLSAEDQLVKLKGCALCAITRDLEHGSARNKPEWKCCKAEIGVPVEVVTVDRADALTLVALEHRAPGVCAEADDGEVVRVLDDESLERCRGTDFRGRLLFRARSLDLAF
jgi:hypothetical protein